MRIDIQNRKSFFGKDFKLHFYTMKPKPKDRYKTSTCPLVLVLRNGEKQSKRGLRAMERRGREKLLYLF